MIRQLGFLAMPIYLAHTLASAVSRIVLSKAFHLQNVSVHLIFGCIAGLAFPVLLYVLMARLVFPYLFTLSKDSALSRAFSTRVVR